MKKHRRNDDPSLRELVLELEELRKTVEELRQAVERLEAALHGLQRQPLTPHPATNEELPDFVKDNPWLQVLHKKRDT
ncbi:hypothetical protein MA03_07190 [Infirmifilum uzonense]|uniref:Uncharacterized protein n=2 Tax=Infirmifilum uzonense TaxID=1550241 RepID=A0A0F7FI57_9CREN|nr:hypothetical protein MA03_07190 [Infirmifilum uzonense]